MLGSDERTQYRSISRRCSVCSIHPETDSDSIPSQNLRSAKTAHLGKHNHVFCRRVATEKRDGLSKMFVTTSLVFVNLRGLSAVINYVLIVCVCVCACVCVHLSVNLIALLVLSVVLNVALFL